MDKQSKWTDTEVYCQQYILNEANPLHFGAQEYVCAMRVLDEFGVKRFNGDNRLSLVGRITNLKVKNYLLESALGKCWEGWDEEEGHHYCKVCGGGMDEKNHFVVHKRNCIWLEVQTGKAPQSASENESACT